MNSNEDKVYIKCIELKRIYNFVARHIFVWTYLHIKIIKNKVQIYIEVTY
jgi:hypothetical protein